MSSLAFDGQSFSLDGKRIFLVGGTIHYARLPRATWVERIASAKSLGLNCITVPVVWARHEPRAGQFDFTGENDLRYLLSLIDKAGLYAIVRIGPFIGSGYDLGGMPAWLTMQRDVQMRANSAAFLECCSRYFNAVATQIRALQVTLRPAKPAPGQGGLGHGASSPVLASGAAGAMGSGSGLAPAPAPVAAPAGGPIILVQSECEWTCGVGEMAPGYLGELNRYIRESGLEVPIMNANQLWQAAEGEIDTWVGRDRLLQDLRQLAQVRQSQPRLLSQYRLTEPAAFGHEQAGHAVGPDRLMHDLAEVLAAGAQFNIEPLCAGISMGFAGGKLPIGQHSYLSPHTDAGAPIDLAGHEGPLAPALRRVSTFASSFARVLAHLDVRRSSVALLPASVADMNGAPGKAQSEPPTSVIHLHGAQGGVLFLFRRGADAKSAKPIDLVLPDGSSLQVHPGNERVNWLLLDARLAGRATLDFSNLTPFCTAGRVLVLYGQPESTGIISINGSTVELTVPSEKDDVAILEHEGVLVVVATKAHLPMIHPIEDGVLLHCPAVTIGGEPIVSKADHVVLRLADNGTMTELKYDPRPRVVVAAAAPLPPPEPVKVEKGKKAKAAPKKPARGKFVPPPPPPPPVDRTIDVHLRASVKAGAVPHLSDWIYASTADYCSGESARFASIAGPADLAQMGAMYGYGWYRVALKSNATRKLRMAWPTGGDRLHIFNGGQHAGTIGYGPGAADHAMVGFKKGEQYMVVLAENLGRFAGTTHIGQVKDARDGRGCVGHALETSTMKVAKPTLHLGEPIEAGVLKGLLLGAHKSDGTEPARVRFSFPHKKKSSVLVRINATAQRGIVLLDDAPLRHFDACGPTWLLLSDEQLGKGNHTLEFAVYTNPEQALADLAEAVTFEEVAGDVTGEGDWAFAKWDMPPADLFSAKGKVVKGAPIWQRCSFSVPSGAHGPLALDLTGLTKGQLYLNGKHLCRYFVQTAEGKPVGPMNSVPLPDSMLTHGGQNEITIFDEHGHTAAKVKLHH